jgi:DNA adenine methylase
MKYPSPLRYPGGKACLTNQLKNIIDLNRLHGIDYAEPFAGGAGLALSLLAGGYVSHVYLNDLDSAVFAFWSSALEETSELCKLIADTPVTVDEWHRQKAIFSDPNRHSILALGFATFFLNRTNHSGVLEGGIIGGLDQTGDYKIDCRFNRADLIQRINCVSSRKADISITRFDGCEFIKEVINNNPQDCLTFIDPPYYKKGHQLYLNAFNHSDHLRLSSLIQNEMPEYWIVTYDDVPEINAMYLDSPKVQYEINYSVSTKQKGREVMYHSLNLQVPNF